MSGSCRSFTIGSVLYIIAMCSFPVSRTTQQMNSSCSEATDPHQSSPDESPAAFFLQCLILWHTMEDADSARYNGACSLIALLQLSGSLWETLLVVMSVKSQWDVYLWQESTCCKEWTSSILSSWLQPKQEDVFCLSKPASPTYLQHIFACLCCRLQPHVEMPTLARHGTELTMTSSTPHRWLQPSILQGFGSSHTSWPWASGMQHHR